MDNQDFFKNIKRSLQQAPQQAYEPADWERLDKILKEKEDSRKVFAWKIIGFAFAFILLGGVLIWSNSETNTIQNKIKESTQTKEIFNNQKTNDKIIVQNETAPIQSFNNETHQKVKDSKLLSGLTSITHKAKTEKTISQNKVFTKNKTTSIADAFSKNKNVIATNSKDDLPFSKTIIENNQLDNTSKPIHNFALNEIYKTTYTISKTIPSITIKPIQKEKLNKFKKKKSIIKKSNLVQVETTALTVKPDFDFIENSKRKTVGIYGTIPFMKKSNLYQYKNPLLLGLRGRHFFNSKWNLDLDIFMLRFKETYTEIDPPQPTPSYVLGDRNTRDIWIQYQFGMSYWFGENKVWRPYAGLSLGGAIVAFNESTTDYTNTVTGETGEIFSRQVFFAFKNSIPIYVNFRAGILYRFKNPRFSCQLEVIHNQMLIREFESPFLPSVTAGIFYHF